MSSHELKCPYCPEVRPSRSRLQTHLDGVHRDVPASTRSVALSSARTVVDVVPDLPFRDTMADRLADVGRRLDIAGEQMAALRAQADAVAAQLERLDARERKDCPSCGLTKTLVDFPRRDCAPYDRLDCCNACTILGVML